MILMDIILDMINAMIHFFVKLYASLNFFPKTANFTPQANFTPLDGISYMLLYN